MLIKYMVHAGKGVVLPNGLASRHGSAGITENIQFKDQSGGTYWAATNSVALSVIQARYSWFSGAKELNLLGAYSRCYVT